jgi:hypothetical protein
MESLPQIGTAAVVVICAGLCLVAILIGGVLLLIVRSGILGDLASGAGAALGRRDKDLGDAGLWGQDEAIPEYRRRRSVGSRSAADIRAQYDQQFIAQVGGRLGDAAPPPPTPDQDVDPSVLPDSDPARRRHKRRFQEEDADADDEIDSFIDDLEL